MKNHDTNYIKDHAKEIVANAFRRGFIKPPKPGLTDAEQNSIIVNKCTEKQKARK